MENYPSNDLFTLLPGGQGKLWVKDVYGNLTQEEFRVKGKSLGGGFAGQAYLLEHIASHEEVVSKVMRASKILKFLIAFLARFLACFDIAWSEVEIRLAILGRELLAFATCKEFGRERVVRSWRKSYTWHNGHFAILLRKHKARRARNGALSGVGDREVKARASFARVLIQFFKKIGVQAYIWQFNHSQREPWGNWYIWLTAIGVFIVLFTTIKFNLPYDPKVNVIAWLFLCMNFAGASWLTADNLRFNHQDEPDLLDCEFGMPHIAFCLPTLGFVWGALYLLYAQWGLSGSWFLFLALVASPGYLFLFEIPRLLASLRAGSPISFGHLEIERYAREYGAESEVAQDIALYRELWPQFEAGRLNPWNRIWNLLFWLGRRGKIALLPWESAQMREVMISRWDLKGKVSSEYALRMQVDPAHYWLFVLVSFYGLISWRFVFRPEYRQQRLVAWRLRRQEKMLNKKQISMHRAYQITRGRNPLRLSVFALFLSYVLRGRTYRFCFERHYRCLFLRNFYRFCTSKEFVARWAISHFRRFLKKQCDEGRISRTIYRKARALSEVKEVHWWLVLYFALLAPKAITWPVRVLAVLGVVMAEKVTEIMPDLPQWWLAIVRQDVVPHVPGWLAGILLGMALTALYEIVLTLVFGGIFRLRIIPPLPIERFRVVYYGLGLSNVALYLVFSVANGIPGFSLLGTPAVVSLSRHRLSFWLLVLIRWQALAMKGVKAISLGMWSESSLGEFYFQKLLVAPWVKIMVPRQLLINDSEMVGANFSGGSADSLT